MNVKKLLRQTSAAEEAAEKVEIIVWESMDALAQREDRTSAAKAVLIQRLLRHG
jgi:hypothetical protein